MSLEIILSKDSSYYIGRIMRVQPFVEFSEDDVCGESKSAGTYYSKKIGEEETEHNIKIPYRKLGFGFFGKGDEKAILYRRVEELVDNFFKRFVPQNGQLVGSAQILGKEYDLVIVDLFSQKKETQVCIGESYAHGTWQGDIGAGGTLHDEKSENIYGTVDGTLYNFKLGFRRA